MFRKKRPAIASLFGVLALLVLGASNTALGQAQTATATALTVTSGGSAVSTVASGSIVTLTATVQAGSVAVRPGQVNFCDAAALHCTDVHILGTAQLTSAGTAKLKFRPAVGTHSYKAVFLGTNTYASSTSVDSSLQVTGTSTPIASSTTVTKTGNWGNYELTGTITEIGSTAPITGTVSFLDTSFSNAALGTAPLAKSTLGFTWLNSQTPILGFGPESETAGDFNGDGILDIAETNIRDNTVKVLLGNGDGTFTLPSTLFTVTNPISIVAADFNGDGILDLAVASQTSTGAMTILLGNGDGTFTQVVATPAICSEASAVTVADLNGDGIPDMAVSSETTGVISILLGNGDGTFTSNQMTLANSGCVSDIASGDFNGDGKTDLVVSGVCEFDQNNSMIILPGNGDGTFQSGIVALTGLEVDSVVVADLNGDGKADLVVGISAGSDTLAILLGNGDGTFTATNFGPPVSTHPASLTVGDFNGDGIPDVAYPSGVYVDSVFVLLGNGDGSFTQSSSVPSAGSISTAIVAGDFNGDGDQDMVVANYFDGTLTVLLTEPMQTATTAPTLIAPASPGQHMVVASYPGAGNYNPSVSATTLLWGQPPTTITTLAVTAGGAPVSTVAAGTAVTLTATVMVGANPLTSGQVNFCDASTVSCSANNVVGSAQLTNNGKATFKFIPGPGQHSYQAQFLENAYGVASTSGVVGLTVGPAPHVLATTTTTIAQSRDIGNYTLTSTVTGTGSTTPLTGNVSFLDTSYSNSVVGTAALGSSSPSLAWPISSSIPFSPAGTIIFATGDFNGDGIFDIAAVNSNAMTLTVLLGNGDGTFRTAPSFTLSAYTTDVVAGDFNGDGKLDLAVSMQSATYNAPGSMTILLGNGDGTFTAAATAPTVGNFANVLAAADLNGDGKLDLLVNESAGTRILLGNGDGTFSQAPATGLPGTLAVADLNGDGLPDLISNSGAVYLSDGDGTFRSAGSALAPVTEPGSAIVADFNGDGIPDIAWSGTYYASVVVFLGKGDGTFTPVAANSNPSIDESIAMAAGDFNHDGKMDLVVTNANSSSGNSQNPDLTILLGTGDGTFTQILNDTQLSTTWSIAAADLNGDGTPDLVVGTGSSISILLTEPTETATATATGLSPTGPAPHLVDASYPGDTNYSASVSAPISLYVQVAAPVITPAAGTYTSTQTVTISDATPGAVIYYSAGGIVSTNGYVPYTGPITLGVTGSESIQAYATESGYQQSAMATATISVKLPPAPTPVISLASGAYATAQSVTISDTAPGVTIYYTVNGSLPSTSSPVYSGPISVATSEIVEAIASGGGYSPSKVVSAQYVITSVPSSFIYTVAGNQTWGYAGDGGLATIAQLNSPSAVALDNAGNLYIADAINNVVRRVDAATGTITTVAGTSIAGYSGDNGPATAGQIADPQGLALDASGNLYIADPLNQVVRKVAAGTGIITTFAGNPTATALGDNGPATSAQLSTPVGLAIDAAGNLYIAELLRVRMVSASTGTITTFTGNGYYGSSGDNGPATVASISFPCGLALDAAGNLYIADESAQVVRKVTAATGVITTVAGKGPSSSGPYYGGDGGPATSAQLYYPTAVAVDGAGNLYISDSYNAAVREVTASTGIINSIAGAPPNCSNLSGDGGPANNACVSNPRGLALDSAGNLYIAENGASRIRMIMTPSLPPTNQTAPPVFNPVPGTYADPQTVNISDAAHGAEFFVTLDGSAPSTASPGLHGAINVSGSVTVKAVALAPGYLPSAPVTATYTISATPASVINTVAGNGTSGSPGAGMLATSAAFNNLNGVAVDTAGNLYIPDPANNVIWMASASSGTLSVVAGTLGNAGTGGNGGPATSAQLWWPLYVALDKAGNLYISDGPANQIRKVAAQTGIITLYAGGASYGGSLGDGGPATSARLYYPMGLAVDGSGNLYIADEYNSRIRMVASSSGIITTVAGGSTTSALGDGGPATSATLSSPIDVAVDPQGNVYIADMNHGRVRMVAAGTGQISTVAGDGDTGTSGDGGPATAAEVFPLGLAIDAFGKLYISSGAGNVRMVAAGKITTVAGTGYQGFSGDNGSATVADLNQPRGLATDSAGNLYIADTANFRVRKVTLSSAAATPVFSLVSGTYQGVQTLTITESTPGAIIYYTTDGTAPTMASSVYTNPITVSTSETIQAVAVASGYANSAVASATYSINLPQAATPTFSVGTGTYTAAQSVTISDSTAGATIYYTSNGTTPTGSSPVYTSPIGVSSTQTIEAMAIATGYAQSAVATATYTINLPVPGFSISGKSVSVAAGATSGNTSTITVTPTGGFAGNVVLTATVTSSPTGAQHLPTLSFGSTSPVSITNANAGTATLTISTTAPTSAVLVLPKRLGVPWSATGAATLACILLFGMPVRRRKWRLMLGMLLLLALTGGVLACGGGGGSKGSAGGAGGGSGSPGTTPGAYTVTVTGTSGNTTTTGTVNLTVN